MPPKLFEMSADGPPVVVFKHPLVAVAGLVRSSIARTKQSEGVSCGANLFGALCCL